MTYKDLPLFENYSHIIGIDEVGRGCWAGPVHVGAYVISPETKFVEGITDSKMLNLKKRMYYSSKLKEGNNFRIKFADKDDIDKGGIGKAIQNLILSLITELDPLYPNSIFVVDGQFAHPFTKNTIKEKKADLNYYSVGAASIIAKVERDLVMSQYHKIYPSYNFNRNKGYGTKGHQNALKEFGVTDLHRRSFKPVGATEKLFLIV